MLVFKFGGASVKDAVAVKNVANILKSYTDEHFVVVISAMGKTTNALEELIDLHYQNSENFPVRLKELERFHYQILDELFEGKFEQIYDELENLFLDLEFYFENTKDEDYDFFYDQVICFGELLSTKIVAAYLKHNGFENKWLDARNFVLTNDRYRNAKVDWDKTVQICERKLSPIVQKTPVITQGFIGSTSSKTATSLGREGSDFTASIFAFSLNAREVLIWKDVPGILNADPKKFKDTVKFSELSYQEAIEMTFYGSKVLHPKTIKPLQNKGIQLHVRSFLNPAEAGTLIKPDVKDTHPRPIIILKEDQCIISLSTKDYSFIAVENLSKIFRGIAESGIGINLMHSSAISFSICVNQEPDKINKLMHKLNTEFEIKVQEGLKLLTIRHYDTKTVESLIAKEEVLLENNDGETVQFVLKKLQ